LSLFRKAGAPYATQQLPPSLTQKLHCSFATDFITPTPDSSRVSVTTSLYMRSFL
jgi:hypothetical protein